MPQVVRVLVWEDVLPAERRVNTDVERFGEGDELVARVARTASGYHDRTARPLSRRATHRTSSGTGRGGGASARSSGMGTSSPSTSAGKASMTGPGRPEVAIRRPLATNSATR